MIAQIGKVPNYVHISEYGYDGAVGLTLHLRKSGLHVVDIDTMGRAETVDLVELRRAVEMLEAMVFTSKST